MQQRFRRSLTRTPLRPRNALHTVKSHLRRVDETPPSPDPAFQEQFEAFDRDGFLIIDSDIPEEVLDGAVSDLDGEHRQAPDHPYGYRDEIRIMDAWPVSENVRQIARAPKILDLLRGLYGREPKPFQTLNFSIGTGDAAHADSMHFNSIPAGFMCGVWVALEDIDMDNGPLFYYPGSQRLPQVTMADLGGGPYEDDYPLYTSHVQKQIEDQGIDIEYGTIRRGQALVWAADLVHGGAERRDPSRSRLSQVTHYFFEGCRYYTPKQSDRWITFWRDPTWIT
jgi:hypothetical protein